MPPLFDVIPVHQSSRYGVTLFYLLGVWVSMHPCEAALTKTGGHYGKAGLKEVLHAPPCINNGQHMWSPLLCVHMAVRDSWPAYNQPSGCAGMLAI
jgi:hypothetical protein